MLDKTLRQYATPRQAEYLDAVLKHGSNQRAAKVLGVSRRTVDRAMVALRQAAARQGYAPSHDMTHAVPDGFLVKGVSTYYDDDGKPRGQWVKSSADDIRQRELMRLALEAMADDLPRIKAPKAPLDYDRDIIPWIQIGDAHLGLLCHAAEVGANFNLEIAQRELCEAIAILIDELPECERLVINDLGDFTHYQNMAGVSESGHTFDVDRRLQFMIPVYVSIMRFIVETALTKAKHVDVIVNQGNHSRTNDIWMAECLRAMYGHTGRVHVLNNGTPFIAYRMGNTLVMTHHSDKCKPTRLVDVMTTDYRKDYGETHFHYVDIGHIHHAMALKEYPGVVVESFNHLAVTDKWAHDQGYRSRKSITMILRSRTYGEVGRRLLPIEQVRDRLGKAHGEEVGQVKEVYCV